ncbi:hypothetical protein ONZ45_g2853 [Pleurotus djamor]|nr:hypothetical protein ONZ45_g2853 [Pleurotus djamor]
MLIHLQLIRPDFGRSYKGFLNFLKNDEGLLALLKCDEQKRDLPVVDTVLKLTSDHNGHLGTENLVGLTKTLTSLPILSHLGLGKGGVSGGLGRLLKRGEDLTIPLLDLANTDLKLNGEEISTRDKIPHTSPPDRSPLPRETRELWMSPKSRSGLTSITLTLNADKVVSLRGRRSSAKDPITADSAQPKNTSITNALG